MKKIVFGTMLVAVLGLFPSVALAGQPGAECGEEGATMEPAGFSSGGFANAETHYAGSEGTPSAAHSRSGHAVSQYDIACFRGPKR